MNIKRHKIKPYKAIPALTSAILVSALYSTSVLAEADTISSEGI